MKEFKAVECPKCKENFIVRFPPKFEVAATHECATHFWEGFEMANKIVENILHGLNFTDSYKPSDIIDLVEAEIEAYKKDG